MDPPQADQSREWLSTRSGVFSGWLVQQVLKLSKLILVLYEDNYSVYGARKLRKALRREHGLVVDKDRLGRLMRELGIRGVHRGRQPFTTKPDAANPRATDLVKRRVVVDRPNQL